MFATLLACVLAGFVLSLPIIRAARRADAARLIVRRGDYLRTRRTRLHRVGANTFGLRS